MLNISPTAFQRFTFKQFIYKLNGFVNFTENQNRQTWEQTRWQSWLILSAFTKKLKLKDLAVFPWESENKMTLNDIERLKQKAEKWK